MASSLSGPFSRVAGWKGEREKYLFLGSVVEPSSARLTLIKNRPKVKKSNIRSRSTQRKVLSRQPTQLSKHIHEPDLSSPISGSRVHKCCHSRGTCISACSYFRVYFLYEKLHVFTCSLLVYYLYITCILHVFTCFRLIKGRMRLD